jgi:protein-tyrosine phosphatase
VIDLHCHLAAAVDDGPKTRKDTLELARALVGAGVTEIACTQHVRPDKGWWNTRELQAGMHATLRATLEEGGVGLPCHQAAEHYFDAEVLAEPFDDRLVPYGESRWLLVELPYQGPPPDLLGPLYRLRRRGWRVLLAHLERYPWVADDDAVLDQVLSAGHLVQVNLGSLAGAYTRAHKKTAARLVAKGHVAVAAGDCHRAADVKKNIEQGLVALRKLVGEDATSRLTQGAPRGILRDEAPEALWP